VTTLWLSPVYRNPEGQFTGRDGHTYEAYHGYWPSEPRQVEPAIGGERALEALVASAHARGLRVILDAVPNHVFEAHPYRQQHPQWFNDKDACVCGRSGCPWSESCWFDKYLPDVEWRHPDVMRAGTDDLRWWMSRFDVDGIRIDAVPMMPRAATRRMAQALRTQAHREGLDLLVLGENYTGPGAGGRALLRTYLGRDLDGLDSEFDFPVLWATRAALGRGTVSMRDLEDEIAAADHAYAGSGAVMGHMIDNHDMSRFITEATGDSWRDPWLEPPPQPTAEEPYRRQLLAMTLIMTLPGMPVIYYGDELGLAGANDPDSRRVMPDELSLMPAQRMVLDGVRTLGRVRACTAALRRGLRTVRFIDAERTIATHVSPGSAAIVVLSRGGGRTVSVDGLADGTYVDVLGRGRLVVAASKAEIPTAPLTAAVYVPEDSSCVE
jgi:glycosidase